MLEKLSILLFTILLISSCKNNITDNPVGNKAPETRIFIKPDTTLSSQPSKIKLFWSGDDPDGFVIGYYFTWDGVLWTFTPNNDSLFAIQIGANDTTYTFRIAAVDNSGDGSYNSSVVSNNINFGAEPFTDYNSNGVWDSGEPFTDIGLIDPEPAQLSIPLKNTAPAIEWNVLSTLPDTSFSAMTFGWDASDLDGNQTLVNIRVALNDTQQYVNVPGTTSRITIRSKDFTNNTPLMDILIDGSVSNINPEKLPGLKWNDFNSLYVQAVDISGAASPWIKLPGEGKTWFVKKPKGQAQFILVDDYVINDNAATFYNSTMDSLGLTSKFDIYDINPSKRIPYLNVTFLETIKLFKSVIWYTDNNPSLELANATTQKYLDLGGKIFFAMQFPQIIDLSQVQGFLPIISDSSYFSPDVLQGTTISADTTQPAFPALKVSFSLQRVRTFYVAKAGVIPVYYFPGGEMQGFMGFESEVKNLFFIGAALQKLNDNPGSVKNLFSKVLFQDFNITP